MFRSSFVRCPSTDAARALLPGAHPGLEYEVRCFLRRVFLDPGSNTADKAFWLTRVLKPWPMVQQARLLYLLYGTTHEGGQSHVRATRCCLVGFNKELLKLTEKGDWRMVVTLFVSFSRPTLRLEF